MTNEEKVKYIEDRLDQYCVSNGSMNDRFVMSAFAYAIRQEAINEMNSKFKEFLEKKRHTELVLSIANVEDSEIWNRHDGKWEILGEIINELFSKE